MLYVSQEERDEEVKRIDALCFTIGDIEIVHSALNKTF